MPRGASDRLAPRVSRIYRWGASARRTAKRPSSPAAPTITTSHAGQPVNGSPDPLAGSAASAAGALAVAASTRARALPGALLAVSASTAPLGTERWTIHTGPSPPSGIGCAAEPAANVGPELGVGV